MMLQFQEPEPVDENMLAVADTCPQPECRARKRRVRDAGFGVSD